MLDKRYVWVVKYTGTEYRVDRKEYRDRNRRESGSLAESLGGRSYGKVRP